MNLFPWLCAHQDCNGGNNYDHVDYFQRKLSVFSREEKPFANWFKSLHARRFYRLQGLCLVAGSKQWGSLSTNDGHGNGNKNGNKAIGLDWQNNNFTRASRFLYILLPSMHDYNVKVPNFAFCRGREQKTTTFFFFSWTLIESFKIQLQK